MRHLNPLTKAPLMAQDDPTLAEKLLVVQGLLQNVLSVVTAFQAVFQSKEVIDGGGGGGE